MSIFQLILSLFVVALMLGLFNYVCRQFPEFINATIVKIINVVVIVLVVIWLAGVFLGADWGHLGNIRVGRG